MLFDEFRSLVERGEIVVHNSSVEDAFQSYIAHASSSDYAMLRSSAYQSLNQFELLYDDMKNGTTKWQDAIEAIKLKYPKPINVEEKEV